MSKIMPTDAWLVRLGAIATERGWVHPTTGELLKAQKGLFDSVKEEVEAVVEQVEQATEVVVEKLEEAVKPKSRAKSKSSETPVVEDSTKVEEEIQAPDATE